MPQMPPIPDDESLRDLIHQEKIAVLSTHNSDGTIHSAPILYRYDGERFHLGTQVGARRVANLEQNPGCTLLIEQRTAPFRFAIVYGTAELVDGDLDERVSILERMYPGETARKVAEHMQSEYGIVGIVVEPVRIATVDYSQS